MSPAETSPTLSKIRGALRAVFLATIAELVLFILLVVVHAVAPYAFVREGADITGILLGVTSIATLVLASAYGYLAYPSLRRPIIFLAVLMTATFVAHLYVINNPDLPACYDSGKGVNGCIMDESYYVPTAESMLNGTQCGPYVPNCNTEHPFLSKAIIAAGITAFGDRAFGWRIFEALLGTFSLLLLFALVFRLSGDRRIAYTAATLLALDVMFFTQSSAALLDIPMAFFGLLAFVAYAYEVKVWKFDRYFISGVFLGLATLSKETGVFLVLTLATYHMLTHREGEREMVATGTVMGGWMERLHALAVVRLSGVALIVCLSALTVTMTGIASTYLPVFEYVALISAVPFVLAESTLLLREHPRLRPALLPGVKILLASAFVFILGMQAYDSLFASSAFPTFVDHLESMLSYGSKLIGPGWTYNPPGCNLATPGCLQITPFSWVTYYQPVTYWGTTVSVCSGAVNKTCYSFPGVAYYGITNLVETWTIYIWVPLAALVAWKIYRPIRGGLEQFGFTAPPRGLLSGDQKVAILSLVWFLWNYVPYVLLYAVGRVTYPFYFVPALPAVATGASYFLTRDSVPRYTLYLYVAGAFLLFFLFFPSKAFLPDWLRVLIGK